MTEEKKENSQHQKYGSSGSCVLPEVHNLMSLKKIQHYKQK